MTGRRRLLRISKQQLVLYCPQYGRRPLWGGNIDEKPSKSARKRRYQAFQELGERLVGLPESTLRTLPLGEDLAEAVQNAKRISSRSALRRQRQLIGKLVARSDAEAIRTALDAATRQQRADQSIFHDAEDWRDRIVREGGPALEDFFRRAGRPDAELAALARELGACASDGDRRRIGRRIFRAVHAKLAAEVQKGGL